MNFWQQSLDKLIVLFLILVCFYLLFVFSSNQSAYAFFTNLILTLSGCLLGLVRGTSTSQSNSIKDSTVNQSSDRS